ncbi:MAG: NAD+ synthase [Deltaproteobacteria bacterium]|jgi:NAD+ synthetase|nr:NAD+ synthase [Deltaproteobacteria bacterium]
MRCAMLQCDTKVGDITGNAAHILDLALEAVGQGAELCITPELALSGYPPRDLLLYPAFVGAVERAAQDLAKAMSGLGVALVLGAVGKNPGGDGKPLHNQALFLHGGKVLARYNKRLLPFYDVFDEDRYFEPGDAPCVVTYKGRRIALTICEDIWNDGAFWPIRNYALDPLECSRPFDLLVNLSASPFTLGKQGMREAMVASLARKYAAPVLYTNLVGGNDDLIFDGRSLCVMPDGSITARGKAFEHDLVLCDIAAGTGPVAEDDFAPESETWRALTLGVRDYCRKSGLRKAVLGLSGGVDSSLTAAIACEALGPGQVLGALMPSPYSSDHSVADAQELARNLGIKTVTLPIHEAMRAHDAILAPVFAGLAPDATEENLQARIRGTLLMALSNKFGAMLLTTGNKSEMSVGYCTIYGDMCGGLAVIGDVYKTEVFSICRWLNEKKGDVIPERVLTKAPSAELRPGQKDQDSLPPYDKLDAILKDLLEKRMGAQDICAAGHKPETVRHVATLVKNAEFKRRQAAPVLKITGNAFGMGWRMPIACNQAYVL